MFGKDKIGILSFYSFTEINKPEELLYKILLSGKKKSINGTILIASEGFNGSISSSEEKVRFLLGEIINLTGASEVNVKINYCDYNPFSKFKVKIKKEIIAMDAGDIDVNSLKGRYVEPSEWDRFIEREDVILVDTRNDYEFEAGTFKGAVNPKTETFKQFPKWVEENKKSLEGKKIAMFCTGGVRCEKSTAYLKKLGYGDVYHLKGGILQYLEDTRGESWVGECFVFDDRRTVGKDLKPSVFK